MNNQRVQRHSDGTKEYWRDVPGCEGIYRVSDRGRLKSQTREIWQPASKRNKGYHKKIRGKFLKGHRDKNGYIIVELAGGKRYGVHRLVLMAFVGEQPKGKEARHLNGNPSDNRIDNLKWDSSTANNRDKIKHGTITRGIMVNTAKLTDNQVREIRQIMQKPIEPGRLRRKRGTMLNLASKYGVSRGVFYNILARTTWRHVK